jgi:hypothetical protein
LETVVAEARDSVYTFEISPSLLIIVSTPFQRAQLHRTPGAALVFDTTFNITGDGLKLSLFSVRSSAIYRYFPVLYCIHRRLDADVYFRIFRAFFQLFGFFGSRGSFCGVTVDFADSITSGFIQASREYLSLHPDKSNTDGNPMAYVRMCCFHFMKNLVAFLRSGVESDEHQTLILSSAKSKRQKDSFYVKCKRLLALTDGMPGGSSITTESTGVV